MIVPMLKYTFLVFHKEYNRFLEELQELGVVHVAEKDTRVTDEIREKCNRIDRFGKAIQFLKKREQPVAAGEDPRGGDEILEEIVRKQAELEELEATLEETRKELNRALPWGRFSPELIDDLRKANIGLRFFTASRKKYHELEKSGLWVDVINEQGHQVLFVLIDTGNEMPVVDAEEVHLPPRPCHEVERAITDLEDKIAAINHLFDERAASSIGRLEKSKARLTDSLSFDHVVLNTSKEANDKLMVMEGWVPQSKKADLDRFLEKNEVVFVSARAKPGDNIPVLLKNNRFSRLFEPIGSMFSLPDYTELDLTVFFAPFFMMFFGFCLGDAGYGLLFVVGAGLYKLKAKKEIRPYLSLIQFLGLATIVFGAVSGTFFGINLIETEIALTENIRQLFFDPNKMFNLSLVLGGVQIIFGLFIRAANRTRQFGFSYSLSTYGWLIILLGGIAYALLTGAGIIAKNKTLLYAILGVGGFFVLLFSDPGVNVFARIGKGVWDVYSTVTGIFGDLLSYIRLFALGLSSAILGFVINDIGLQILGSSKILGPVFFVVFLLFGHTLNILISSLGSFVHPMRLTFVEFYKSAGFKGGGAEYKPFKK